MKGAIGMLGDGQLAQMTCLAARELGIPCHVYASSTDSPAALVADRVFVGDFLDHAALAAFADSVDAIGYDTELLPIDCVRFVAQRAAACPHPDILFATQNRIRERALLRTAGAPMPRVAAVESEADIERAGAVTGWPAILKTAEQGYDGKGQAAVADCEAAQRAFAGFGNVPCILEQRVHFAAEMSVIVAGDGAGRLVAYPVTDNLHRRHILHQSSQPSALPATAQRNALDIALAIAETTRLRGLLAVEMFYTEDGQVLVNELAPRPHNSGHHTQLTSDVSQFAQLVRILAGQLPQAPQVVPGVMINLLGDALAGRADAPWRHVGFVRGGDADADVFFYGKREARPGRKMGHVVARGPTLASAQERAWALVRELVGDALTAEGDLR